MVEGERSNRRQALRRLEDCLELLEAARTLGATVLTPGLAAAVNARLPDVVGGMAMADAIAAAIAALENQTGPEPAPRERRYRHRRPAFDPKLLIDEVLPPER